MGGSKNGPPRCPNQPRARVYTPDPVGRSLNGLVSSQPPVGVAGQHRASRLRATGSNLMLFLLHAPLQLNYQLFYQLLWLLPSPIGLAVARPTRRWRRYAGLAAGLLVLSGLSGWIIYYAHLLPVVGLLLLVLLLQLLLFIRPIVSRRPAAKQAGPVGLTGAPC